MLLLYIEMFLLIIEILHTNSKYNNFWVNNKVFRITRKKSTPKKTTLFEKSLHFFDLLWNFLNIYDIFTIHK